MEPERRGPGAYRGVDEDIGLHLTHLALYLDDAFCILLAGSALVGTYSAELCTDSVELEEIELVVREHLPASRDEGIKVGLVAQLHAAATAPVFSTECATLAITAYRTKPCAYV